MTNRIKSWPVWARVIAAVVAVLVLVVAGSGAAVAKRLIADRAARSPAARVTAQPSPSVPVATPTPTPSPVPVASTLTCRLPISTGQVGGGGFITFPEATFTADPNSAVKADASYGLSFDRAAAKWLPVPRSFVAPDGSRYAYWDYRTRAVQAVMVATDDETALGPKINGAASAARVNANGGWQVIESLDVGVYAVPTSYPPAQGLWLFPWSGAGERQVTGTGFWHAVGGGAAWGTISQSVPEGAANTILRLDLGGGDSAEWFSRPGLQSHVVGFDLSGHPVIQATSRDMTEVWLVTGQGNGTKLLTLLPTGQQAMNGGGPVPAAVRSVVGDDKGIWLATSDGLYLVTAAGTEKVSTITGQLGGGCA